MAAPDALPDFNERVHSDTWWKVKTGWTDTEYLSRKNALLKRIRDKWSNKLEGYNYHDLADGIESLVATFDDCNWCLPGETDRTVVFAEQLRLYTKWARMIRSDHAFMSSNEMYTMSPSAANLSIPLLTTSFESPTLSTTRPAKVNQFFTAPTTKSNVTTAHNTMDLASAKQLFDWDDVEVRVEVVGGSTYSPTTSNYYFPMTDLRAGKAGSPCHWSEFTYAKFADYCEKTLGLKQRQLLVWIDGKLWAHVGWNGSFQLMLKRFSEKRDTEKILHLFWNQHSTKIVDHVLEATPRNLFKEPTSG